MTNEAIAHGIPAPGELKGPAGFKVFFRDFRNQFENIQIEVKDVIKQDDMETAHTVVTAIHKETGREVSFTGLCLVRIENGKIAEAWNEYNFMSMNQQLGYVLTPLAEA
jgi:ketosteroid isomerase-like protein